MFDEPPTLYGLEVRAQGFASLWSLSLESALTVW